MAHLLVATAPKTLKGPMQMHHSSVCRKAAYLGWTRCICRSKRNNYPFSLQKQIYIISMKVPGLDSLGPNLHFGGNHHEQNLYLFPLRTRAPYI